MTPGERLRAAIAEACSLVDPRLSEVDWEAVAIVPTVNVEQIKAEYQRFYDFVADCDTEVVDAWHFTENVRKQQEAMSEQRRGN
jgi:hypothetical protein